MMKSKRARIGQKKADILKRKIDTELMKMYPNYSIEDVTIHEYIGIEIALNTFINLDRYNPNSKYFILETYLTRFKNENVFTDNNRLDKTIYILNIVDKVYTIYFDYVISSNLKIFSFMLNLRMIDKIINLGVELYKTRPGTECLGGKIND